MNNYELLYIIPASLTSEEIVKNFQDVQKHVEKFGGKMLETLLEHPFLTKTGMSKEEEPEELQKLPVVKRKLAYTIKHEKFGYYCLVNFEAEPKKIEEIDEYLRLNAHVLRHIIIQADPMSKEQLELLQTLFARKKAEQDKEEAERENSTAKEEPKKIFRREAEEIKPKVEVAVEETKEEVRSEIAEAKTAVEEAPAGIKETKEEEKIEEKKAEEKKPEVKEVKEKKTKETKKDDEAKEDKKSGRKTKIKLEELEDKLDEILEDTIV